MRCQTRRWVQVELPRVWRPVPGESFEGKYGGSIVRNGVHGVYNRHVVHGYDRSITISGSVLDQLIAASGVKEGDTILVVFEGEKAYGKRAEGKFYKQWRLYVER